MFKKPLTAFVLAGLGLLLHPLSNASAQQTVRVTVDSIDVSTSQTPTFTFRGPRDKRVRERDWIEIEVSVNVEKAPNPSDPLPMVPELQFRYFVLFAGTNPQTNQRYMATGVIDHVNVRTGQTVRSVAYIPPDAMFRFTGGRDNYSQRDIEAVAIEVLHNGQLVGGDATAQRQAAWWRGTFPGTPGFVRAKPDTPFAPLWYDFHLDVKVRE